MGDLDTCVSTPIDLTEEIAEPAADVSEFGHTDESEESGELTEQSAMVQLDVYLHRKFAIGELLPWKGVTFQTIGIRNGIIALQARSIKTAPLARHNHGRRKSRSKKKQNKRVIKIGD